MPIVARSPFVRDEGKQRLGAAVKAIEARSSAEIVVAVQPWSSSWVEVDCGTGAAVSYLALLYTLFAPQEFGLGWIALIVPAAFFAGFMLSRALPGLRMRLAGKGRVQRAVEQAARARFVELGVASTRERTGVLVFVSLAERACAVVSDIGVKARVPTPEWAAAVARIGDALAVHGVAEAGLAATSEAVRGLGDVLEGHLPRAADDVNELEDVA
jgi:putative membrane protein